MALKAIKSPQGQKCFAFRDAIYGKSYTIIWVKTLNS